jgi:glycosyltransferase involved in cell wall biosynthesis
MLNYEFPPIGGGAAIANYYLLRELRNTPDLEIDLVTSGSSNKFEVEQVFDNIRIFKLNVCKKAPHYWTMSEIARWTWKACWFSRKLINENNYDLCHCWSAWPPGIIGYLFRKKMPYIVALRGSDVPGYNPRLKILDRFVFRFISRIICENARVVTALSRNLKQLAEKTFNGINIEIILNGVDIDKFKPVVNEPNCNINILFVGRLIRRKGIINLLKAFKEVRDDYKNCQLTIVGGGPKRKYLEDFCKQIKIESNVNFLGAVEYRDIDKIYQKADIFVLPSIEESLSNVIQEAMASGLPIITTDTGAAELIDENGFIVERGDYKEIKKAIIEYISNPELMGKHGQQSRKVAEKMSWSNNAKAYIEIYNSVK